MSRRKRSQTKQSDIDSLLAELDQLKSSPLGEIFAKLQSDLIFIQAAFNGGGCSQSQFETVISHTRAIFQLLPQKSDNRFWFDAHMIHAIKESWNGLEQKLSHFVFPIRGEEWAHQGAFLPVGHHPERRVAVNVIFFPGDGDLGSIDLLDYPFLCHELSHNLYFFGDSFFRERFTNKLSQLVAKLRLQSISDHGAAKMVSERVRNEIEAYWRPTANHQNWAHEIAMDLTAVWTCGPAYLAALLDVLDDDEINPYQLSQEHPPYAVRIEALILACRQLGWGRDAADLEYIAQEWRNSSHHQQINNRYVALTDPALIADCTQCVLATCQHLNLPKCDQQTIARIRQKLKRGETPDWGTELVLAAWLKHESDEANYHTWQQAVIRELLDSLTP